MEKIKEELKIMQKHPNLYLANYFSDLKHDVDLRFFEKEDENSKYIEIITKIEQIEQDYYNRSKSFNTFDQEINSLVELDVESIDDLKYKIEEKLFQKKTILFIEDFGKEKKTFLLILTNGYLRKSKLDNFYEYFNKESLVADFLHKQPLGNNIEEFNFLNSLKLVDSFNNQIKKIHPATFKSLTNLEEIRFIGNEIKELDPATFKGLNFLRKIYFSLNKITTINPSTFNGLNLDEIYFDENEIKELDPTTFTGLTSLKLINFNKNEITKLHPSTFKGLTDLKRIYFTSNQITMIHPATFNDLINLEEIHFNSNKIEELDPTLFKGLRSLKTINFINNQIKKIHPATFTDLTNLECLWFNSNKIEDLDPTTFNGLNNLRIKCIAKYNAKYIDDTDFHKTKRACEIL
jgi:Leucine-rich repeat (LRR) protein